jgi:hypothetical protein
MRRQLAILTAAGALAVALVGCGPDGDADAGAAYSPPTSAPTVETTVAPTTIPAPGPTTTARAPTPAAPLTPSSRLRVDGIGPIRVGMTLAQARAAAGRPLELRGTEFCQSLVPAGARPFVTLVATAPGDVVDVVSAGPGTKTVSGIRIGSTEQEVLSAYGDRAQVLNPGEQVHRIVYRAADSSLGGYALVFEVGDGRVTAMNAGTDAVLADEICA